MKRLIAILVALTSSPGAVAHGGHWHIDEETLAMIFATADTLYGWFATHVVAIAAILVAILTLWLLLWWRQQRRAQK